MSNLAFQVDRIQCQVELNESQFEALLKLDYLAVVNPALVKAGALDDTVEYDGLFGMSVFFTCENEQQAQAVTDALETLLAP